MLSVHDYIPLPLSNEVAKCKRTFQSSCCASPLRFFVALHGGYYIRLMADVNDLLNKGTQDVDHIDPGIIVVGFDKDLFGRP